MPRLFSVLTLVLALAIATAPARSAQPQADPGAKGVYEVGFTSFTLVDNTRADRPIPVYLWYPVDPQDIGPANTEAIYSLDPVHGSLPSISSAELIAVGISSAYAQTKPSSARPFPLIVFSPGWTNRAWEYTYLATRMASHGFVVASVTHMGEATSPADSLDHIATALVNRPRDISYLLTDLLAKNADKNNVLYGTITPEDIAVGGHSLGGYAAMTLVAGDDSVCDLAPSWGQGPPPPETCVPTWPDSRIRVIFTLDGSNQVLKFKELARVSVPSLGMGQEWGFLALQNMASWQARQHAAFTGQPSYRADVYAVNHLSFSDMCMLVPVLDAHGIPSPYRSYCDPTWLLAPAEAHRLVAKYSIAFLKTELARESGYHWILSPGYALTTEHNIEFFVTEGRNARSIEDDSASEFVYFPHQPGSAQMRGPKEPGLDMRMKAPIWLLL